MEVNGLEPLISCLQSMRSTFKQYPLFKILIISLNVGFASYSQAPAGSGAAKPFRQG